MRYPLRFRVCAPLALLTLAVVAGRATSQSGPDLREKLGNYLQAHHEIGQLSGAVLVADGGEIVYQGAFGLANADWRVANTVDTRFRLASITKQFTAMLVLLLVEDGKLALDAPITKYLPDYPAASGDRVTLRHLLNHTSGIPSYTDRPGFLRNEGKSELPVAEFVAKYCSDPLEFEPGTKFHYNNSAYFLLGAIVETVTGTTYRDALRAHVLTPLGMNDTDLDDEYAVVERRAMGYDEVLGGHRVALWMDMSVPYAAGGMYSTVGDLWRWDQALRGKRLLGGKLEREMFTPGLEDYGFGWWIRSRSGNGAEAAAGPPNPVVEHSGGMPGVSTLIWRRPALGRCVIVLGNTGGTAHGPIQRGVVEILDGGTPKQPRPRGDFEIARCVLTEGIEPALAQLAKWPEVMREKYIERDVNRIGYGLLEQRRFDEAIKLFEFLTAAYPDSANTWDSLGEGHMRAGNRDLAIKNYEKALALDPDSATVPGILERLRDR